MTNKTSEGITRTRCMKATFFLENMFGLKYAFSLLRHQSSFERYDDTWAFPFGKQTGLKVSQLNEAIQNRTKCKEKMVVFGWADELLITKID